MSLETDVQSAVMLLKMCRGALATMTEQGHNFDFLRQNMAAAELLENAIREATQ